MRVGRAATSIAGGAGRVRPTSGGKRPVAMERATPGESCPAPWNPAPDRYFRLLFHPPRAAIRRRAASRRFRRRTRLNSAWQVTQFGKASQSDSRMATDSSSRPAAAWATFINLCTSHSKTTEAATTSKASGLCSNNLHSAWDTRLVVAAVRANVEDAATKLAASIAQEKSRRGRSPIPSSGQTSPLRSPETNGPNPASGTVIPAARLPAACRSTKSTSMRMCQS